ncbi:aspartate carbamoyltransferase [Thermospira aquatica]|uniref:Aspartate carbamoyltransferase n=1 Tax=Thermospira aquatica TaxID=2828656 RepID=A0AAX3BHT9_9SPIR|nr:aspartate carbamoyltransferase [Thermospira aquatica]URA10966.1 aspartate carbamoyltransferase [Thermospira aquatica]
MKLFHILDAKQFTREILEDLFLRAIRLEKQPNLGLLAGKIMVTLFYEPSTRTRLSFETAMIRLGGNVVSTENAAQFSSAAKGETIEDTVRVISGYGDVVVIRHFEEGAAYRASQVSSIPVINAGDGTGQHPTQALLDLYTIQKELGHIDDVSVAMVGDLANGRTVRSLAYLLSFYKNIRLFFVSPPNVRMRDDIKEYLQNQHIPFEEVDNLNEVASKVDVIYQTRIQRERFSSIEEYEKTRGIYIITRETLSLMQSHAIVMHPLPRVDEIAYEVDNDPRAAYFRQAHNGLFIRMALLEKVLVG